MEVAKDSKDWQSTPVCRLRHTTKYDSFYKWELCNLNIIRLIEFSSGHNLSLGNLVTPTLQKPNAASATRSIGYSA